MAERRLVTRGSRSCPPPSRGLAALEYALFVAVVAAALAGMSLYVNRAIQANLKTVEDQINAEAMTAPTPVPLPGGPPGPGPGPGPGPWEPGPGEQEP